MGTENPTSEWPVLTGALLPNGARIIEQVRTNVFYDEETKHTTIEYVVLALRENETHSPFVVWTRWVRHDNKRFVKEDSCAWGHYFPRIAPALAHYTDKTKGK